MNVRRFKIRNEYGQEYNLLTRQHFLHSPSGLGYKEATIYQQLGEMFEVVDEGFEQGKVEGAVFFPQPGAYTRYFEFVNFCQGTPLYLYYTPNNGIEYIRNVRLDTIQKTELETGGLNCEVTFTCTSLWYKKLEVVNEGEAGGGKMYTYSYDYVYGESAMNTVMFDLDTWEDSPVKLTIFGACTNPRWSHYVNDKLVATGGVNGTINAGMKLVIDTTRLPYSILEYNNLNEVVLDMYQFSDFSTERFITAKRGRNTISISHTDPDALRMGVEVNEYYASV